MRPGSTSLDHQSHAMDKKHTIVLGVNNIGSTWLRILQDDNLDEAGWLDFLENDVFST
jgi:hypothetical protein